MAFEWTDQDIYELLCEIDLGYEPSPTEHKILRERKSLDLPFKKLLHVPSSIRLMRSLCHLDLSGNKITVLPYSMGTLSNLEWLDLYSTSISYLPDCIWCLENLQFLDISNTNIRVLPETTKFSPKLLYINLSRLTLPRIPRSLALRNTKFVQLEYLEFRYDSLLKSKEYIGSINIKDTVLTKQDLSVFWETPELIPLLYEDQIAVRECRILFLGDGDSGKSYTIKRIKNGGKKASSIQPYHTKETPGVAIVDYDINQNNGRFTVHFWDFGGQEILHSMHRCFLSDKAFYVVTVKSRETKGTQRARYWLRNITAFAPTSKILLYVNCWDNDNGRRSIDEPRLRKDFPNIIDVVYCSAKEADDGEFASRLLHPLTEMATCNEGCIRTVNRNWDAVRIAISSESRQHHYLTKEQYRQLCRDNSIEAESAPALLTFFNALGVCFSYHRDEDNIELDNYKLLNPVWLTNAIYAIIEEGMIHAQEGKIKIASIQQILGNHAPETVLGKTHRRTMPDIVYSESECQYVIDVAAAHNLCYKVDNRTLFFPALCTNNTPEDAMQDQAGFQHNVEYRFKYEYLPDSVLHRLMIRCLKKGFAVRNCWLRGMVFDCMDTHRVIVRMDDDETLRVEIWFKDLHAAWEIFPMLRNEIIHISDGMNLKAKELIAEQTDSFSIAQLLGAHRSNNDQCWGNDTGNEYSVKNLLNRFYDSETLSCLEIESGRLVIKPYEFHRRKTDSKPMRRAIYEAYGEKCQYCNKPLEYDEMQIDHILATNHLPSNDNRVNLYLARLEQRGFDLKKPDYLENYFPSCGKCNRGKSNATRNAVTLQEYHAIAMEHLETVLALDEKYKNYYAVRPDLF